jgi:hypothetical protein
MKISKLWIYKFCLIAGLIFTVQGLFATDITIRKDDPVPPPQPIPNSVTQEIPVSATIDNTQLVIYFEESVGDATITVYDANNQMVTQETVDTDSISEVYISSGSWNSGSYYVTISYGTTNLIGDFEIE